MPSEVNQLWRFEGFELDPSNRLLTAGGEPIFLHGRTFDLLLYLVRNPGRLLTKEELMNAVWGDTAVEESNLKQNVFMLRKALAPGLSEDRKLIVTVQGRGYRFDAVVEANIHADGGVDVAEVPPQPVRVEAPRKTRVTPRYALAAVALALVVLAGAGWLWYTRSVPGDHHEIVLADFEDATTDPGVDKALNIALTIDLNQSPFLLVAPAAKIRRTLTLMERSPEERLTAGLAREVCQRIDAQAVVSGAIARFDRKYLITLTASDCAGGQDLAETKAVADRLDDVPRAMDSVASDMRRQLGEPLRSRRRFNTPLLAKRTGSLDALKAYSEGHRIATSGRFQESIPFFRRAVELDPRFAIAWRDLGTVYGNLGEPSLSAAATRKAWELRDLADERDRLLIEGTYHFQVTHDQHETIRAYEQYTETWAHDAPAWANLASAQTEIGRPDLSIEPARHAISVDAGNAAAYVILARAQMRIGQLDQALTTCHQAVVQKLDGPDIHGLMLSIAFARGDSAAIDEQLAWARGTSSEPYITLQQFLMMFAEGRPGSAVHLLA